jgi:Putative Actinobacterial Holin-X, holin superfamily III
MVEGQPEPSVGDLLSALARDTGVLMRQELQLVTTEMTLKARIFARNTGLIAFGGALALAGGLALLTACIAALHLVLPLWLSALIVGVVVTAAGYAFMMKGISALKHIDAVPAQTLSTLSADVAWAKEQVR